MPAPDLISYSSLATYTGLSGTVIVVTNGLTNAFGLKEKPGWLGLAVSLVICVAVKLTILGRPSAGALLLAVLNAFLVYAAALGGNDVGAHAARSRRAVVSKRNRGIGSEPQVSEGTGFFRPWW